jgi:hypothetical protein
MQLGRTIRQRSFRSLERLLKVSNNIIDMLRSNRDTNRIFSNTRILAFLISKLFMGRRPRVNSQGFRIANTEGTLAKANQPQEKSIKPT